MSVINGINVVFISDLHTLHAKWEVKMIETGGIREIDHADVIVFCGDMSSRGYKHEVQNFLEWFDKALPSVPKIFIAGNHDFFWEEATEEMIQEVLEPYPNLIYLNDSGCEVLGLKFWGSPVTPWFHDWAFNRFRSQGEDGIYKGIKPYWDAIPDDTDVLVVHGPPRGKLDLVAPRFRRYNERPNVGCDDLLEAVYRVKPKVCAFGHIHEAYGILSKETTQQEIDDLDDKLSRAHVKLIEMQNKLNDINKSEDPDGWKKANKVKGAVKSNIEKLKRERELLSEPDDITFVNASCLNEDYKPMNPPITVRVTGKSWE